ncbi:MAG: EAL domain-containing protein [Dactylosporangium sp.]|nr:EAL domain-containing protein [Dactylosporangium sp.]
MGAGPTIGVLSPFLGGPYFGGIIAALSRSVRQDGGRTIAVQTLDAGSESADVPGPPDFRHPAAWQHVDGFVVIIDAVPSDYLQAIREAGKPVVVIAHEYQDFTCPVVASDNVSGVREAVEHLLQHGHTKIGFIGYLGAHDIIVRQAAYHQTLISNGIEPDPGLCFAIDDNSESGGEQAAQLILDAGLPFTAVVAATDANAIGLLRELTTAGVSVPDQLAVVGFDDMEEATYSIPSLSSVKQPFATLGTTGYSLLTALLRGEPVADGLHYVHTSFIVRESCGCARTAQADLDALPPATREVLSKRLAGVLDPSGCLQADTALEETVDIIATVLESTAQGRPMLLPTRFHHALRSLYRRTTLRANMEEIGEIVRQFALGLTRDLDSRTAVEQPVQEIILKLAQARARGQFGDSTYYQSALSTQYVVSMDLLRSHEKDPRTLEWLSRTRVLAGCLGLWTPGTAPGNDEPQLDLVGTFVRGQPASVAPPTTTAISEFPPKQMIDLAEESGEAMTFVIPVKSHTSDWGMLSIVGTIESTVPTGRETISQWSALLTVALDHEAVLHSLREQEDRLRRAALYDELTGLPNRALFIDRLRQSIRKTKRRSDYQFAVLFLDLDGFKVINDSLGHPAGDRLLVQVAERIKADLREVDTAARFGGDEFLVLLEDIGTAHVPMDVARRLHSSLKRPFRLQGQDVVASASIGIAMGSTRYNDAEEVLRDADIAMYTAKSREKGSHAIFDVEMHARAVSRLQIEAELRLALKRNELEVHYQPIVDLRTRATSGFEALLRWRHPARGLVPPGEFLHVAEESGLMLPIGRWVLEESCMQLGRWHATDPDKDLRMSVNVSNRQFWHGDLMDDLDDCLRAAGIRPEHLALEITEGVIMNNVDLARKMLEELHNRGVELHIDDFGTGYSSLEALHRLPIDALKIDRSFVARLGSDPRSGELVRTIVLMGGNLGLEVIAEGIETESHSDHLRRLGTTYGQGFWFARPTPGTTASRLIPGRLPKPD